MGRIGASMRVPKPVPSVGPTGAFAVVKRPGCKKLLEHN